MKVANSTSINVSVGTLVLWMKPLACNACCRRYVEKGNFDTESYRFLENSSCAVSPFIYTTDNRRLSLASYAMTRDQYYMLAMVFNNTFFGFYVNGRIYMSSNTSSYVKTGSADFLMGGGDSGDKSNVQLDDVRIYNRALSADEIQALYSNSAGRYK